MPAPSPSSAWLLVVATSNAVAAMCDSAGFSHAARVLRDGSATERLLALERLPQGEPVIAAALEAMHAYVALCEAVSAVVEAPEAPVDVPCAVGQNVDMATKKNGKQGTSPRKVHATGVAAPREIAIVAGSNVAATVTGTDAKGLPQTEVVHVVQAPLAEHKALMWELAARGQDAELLRHAIAAAGSQQELSRLSGISEGSLSKGGNGRRRHGFSPVTKNWLAAYAADPSSPPPPLQAQAGQRPRAGAQAPQVNVSTKTSASFNKLKARFGQRAVFEWAMTHYLAQLGDGPLPTVKALPKGAKSTPLRCYRVDADLLARFEERCGGPEGRSLYLRRAIEVGVAALDGLDKLPAPVAVPAASEARAGAKRSAPKHSRPL